MLDFSGHRIPNNNMPGMRNIIRNPNTIRRKIELLTYRVMVAKTFIINKLV
jgi:hypothetical protein